MLQNYKAFSGFSVDDINVAKNFYQEKLGLEVNHDDSTGMIMLGLDLNGCNVMVYPKPDHRPATYTVLNFEVKDLDKIVIDLTNKGVKFEQYKNEYVATEPTGIARGNGSGPDIAWFKDPAGNIMALLSQP